MQLSDLKSNSAAQVTSLEMNVMSGRLMALGIRKGALIKKLHKTTGGGALFQVEDHRVVLHHSLAKLIEVEEKK